MDIFKAILIDIYPFYNIFIYLIIGNIIVLFNIIYIKLISLYRKSGYKLIFIFKIILYLALYIIIYIKINIASFPGYI